MSDKLRRYQNLYDMKKRLIVLTLFCLTVATQMMAQGMRVVEFKLLENDLTANTRGTEKMDQNGERAALIKIQTQNADSPSMVVRWV